MHVPESEQAKCRELNLRDKIDEKSVLGLYAMNGGEGPNSYTQNSSYQYQVMNDFNTLFRDQIPRCGCTLDFACALNWLSGAFPQLGIKGELAGKEVFQAYSNHYANDITCGWMEGL
ncbi:S-adenosyl-L-methionine-dependentmethyltransferases superfamily protein [Striga asiatica]|uniref:S-adenosyl-L-methionine-dependentmethyltransferases superfamily protein n=1 Tax=Striga asiatica TaxID=4170 RepID=A0A5A7QH26_STRAF|nr:S-adenosyl-L-methionine-dependentmethyltransferases superfamily protein [Striga asiatica]